jgi:lysozyme
MNPSIIILLAFMAGAFMLAQYQISATQGSGEGTITTDNGEGAPDALGQIITQAQSAIMGTVNAALSLSADGLQRLKGREGFSASAYPDHKGFSIGYGHLIRTGDGLSPDSRISEYDAMNLLASDVSWAENAVNRAIAVLLAQCEFDALVSFAYNVGAGAFKASTLVKRINNSDPNASDEFSRWVYASGQKNSALVARRNDEKNQYDMGQA